MNYEYIKIENLSSQDYDVYKFLKENNFSEHFIRGLRKQSGYILVNGKAANTKTKISNGDTLQIERNPYFKNNILLCEIPLDIIYEDEYYLAVNKPSNLSCIPTRSHINDNLGGAICNYMKDKCENFVLRILGRLDKDTSGIILVAKDSIACQKVEILDKTYYAICNGHIENQVIDKPILTITSNGKNELKRVISELGKSAKTFINPILYFGNYTLCEMRIEHGRTHQIRLHLSSVNHPLVGDSLYGNAEPSFNHTALVCKKLSFKHLNGNIVNLEIPLPNEFLDFIDRNK